MSEINNYNDFLKKIAKVKKEHKLGLSSGEDLSIAIMNLVSLEEHFFFTGAKTGQDKNFDLLQEVREMRKTLLKKIVKDTTGEEWCISKHLLAASMRLIEVGTKYHSQKKTDEARKTFTMAYDLYSLFWGVNLKLINTGEVVNNKKQPAGEVNEDKAEERITKKLNELVEKLVDCCDE